jgi:catechol 2,3-dioxygenase-like lactoylglutathione lyase family enzyme
MNDPTHITRIGTVIVPVRDQDEAIGFYTDTLGFEVRIDGDFGGGQRWVEVAPPGAATTIALVPQGQSSGVEISFATEDAEADNSAMLTRDVDADAEVLRMGEEVPPMFTFRDRDGNPFRVVERE